MAEYSRGILKIVVAQICQIIGWHSINSTPLEFMVDLMQEYLLRVSRLAHQYAEILGRTDVNLDDMGLAFQQMNIDVHQLAEYVKNVDSVPCVIAVPKLSIFHDNHLNFLKPGSREVVTRSVHVHEHLPAMNIEILADEVDESSNNENTDSSHDVESIENEVSSMMSNTSSEIVFKRPCDPLSEHPSTGKRSKVTDESRPLREIHSVMMTTSGFLSPAREGKLPESRTPAQPRPDSPSPSSYPMVPPELRYEKKMKKIVKKAVEDRKLDKENKKKNREKELFKPDKINDPKLKKTAGVKESLKSKSLKVGGGKTVVIIPASSTSCSSQPYLQKEDLTGKIPKKSSPKLKNEKIFNAVSTTYSESRENNFTGKLPAEPDKQKLNIFKKISKPREDKSSDIPEPHKVKEVDLHSSSAALLCTVAEPKLGRNDIGLNLDETKVLNLPDNDIFSNAELMESGSPPSDVYMFDDMSPPGTPSTPKTPELSVPGCVIDQKKKRKDKSNRKKDNVKSIISRDSAMKNKSTSETPETDLMSRPKTPDAPETSIRKDTSVTSALSFPFFPTFPSAPGLIPHPIHHPIFSRFPLPLPRGPPNPHLILQNLPLPPRFLPPNSSVDEVPLLEEKLFVPDSEKMAFTETTSKMDTEKSAKINKPGKQHNMLSPHLLEMSNSRYEILGSSISSSIHQLSQKTTKSEKNDKKSKKHKIEKKEKVKKKKDKKEKHKEKLEKNKEKKEKLEKILKARDRKERKDKRKDKDKEEKESEAVPKITLKLGTAPPSPPVTECNLMKKITIKPLVKKVEDSAKRESSPELAKISALVTRPPKQKPARMKQEAVTKKGEGKDERAAGDRKISETTSTIMDQGGHQVWICPACGNQDDGSPMIGCDDCDAWYHWVCVGMQVPPAANEDWYCRLCIAKKQGLHHDKKKKKRKKKVKVVN